MKKTATATRSDGLPSSYADLVALHMPRPIHDRVSCENTVEVIDTLAGHKLNADQEDYLELLSQLVETYESAHLKPCPKGTGAEVLRFLLAEHDGRAEGVRPLIVDFPPEALVPLMDAGTLPTEPAR